MSTKYEGQLVVNFVEHELGKFIRENSNILSTTVGEVILIMQTTTDFINDMLQGLPSKENQALVVESTLEHVKKLLLMKVGKYEKTKTKNR